MRDLTVKIFISMYLTLSDGLYFETGLHQRHICHGFYRGLYQGYTFLYHFLLSSYIYPRPHFCSPYGANRVKQFLTLQ